MLIDTLAEGFRNGTFSLRQDEEKALYWSERQRVQIDKLEERLGRKTVFPAGYFQRMRQELGMIESMLLEIGVSD